MSSLLSCSSLNSLLFPVFRGPPGLPCGSYLHSVVLMAFLLALPWTPWNCLLRGAFKHVLVKIGNQHSSIRINPICLGMRQQEIPTPLAI